MKSKYNATSNYVEELPGEKPYNYGLINEMIQNNFLVGVSEGAIDDVNRYNAHLASLRRIPCHLSCVGKWSDGQEVVNEKDYAIRCVYFKDGEEYVYDNPQAEWETMGFDHKILAFPLPVKSEASELERMGLLLMQKDAVIEARDARIAELEGEVNDMKDEISSKDSIVEGLEQQVATWSKQDCVNVSRIKDIEAENLQMRDGLYCIIGRIEGVEWEGLEMIQAIQKIKEYATEALKTT